MLRTPYTDTAAIGQRAGWMATDWCPRARRTGRRHHAGVFANNFFGHRATGPVLARTDGGQLLGYEWAAAAHQTLLAS